MGMLYTVVSNLGNFSQPMNRVSAKSYARTLINLGNEAKVMNATKAERLQEVIECNNFIS